MTITTHTQKDPSDHLNQTPSSTETPSVPTDDGRTYDVQRSDSNALNSNASALMSSSASELSKASSTDERRPSPPRLVIDLTLIPSASMSMTTGHSASSLSSELEPIETISRPRAATSIYPMSPKPVFQKPRPNRSGFSNIDFAKVNVPATSEELAAWAKARAEASPGKARPSITPRTPGHERNKDYAQYPAPRPASASNASPSSLPGTPRTPGHERNKDYAQYPAPRPASASNASPSSLPGTPRTPRHERNKDYAEYTSTPTSANSSNASPSSLPGTPRTPGPGHERNKDYAAYSSTPPASPSNAFSLSGALLPPHHPSEHERHKEHVAQQKPHSRPGSPVTVGSSPKNSPPLRPATPPINRPLNPAMDYIQYPHPFAALPVYDTNRLVYEKFRKDEVHVEELTDTNGDFVSFSVDYLGQRAYQQWTTPDAYRRMVLEDHTPPKKKELSSSNTSPLRQSPISVNSLDEGSSGNDERVSPTSSNSTGTSSPSSLSTVKEQEEITSPVGMLRTISRSAPDGFAAHSKQKRSPVFNLSQEVVRMAQASQSQSVSNDEVEE